MMYFKFPNVYQYRCSSYFINTWEYKLCCPFTQIKVSTVHKRFFLSGIADYYSSFAHFMQKLLYKEQNRSIYYKGGKSMGIERLYVTAQIPYVHIVEYQIFTRWHRSNHLILFAYNLENKKTKGDNS